MVLFFSHASPGINICIDIHRDDVISIMYKDCTKSKWSLYPTKFVNCEKLAIVAARNSWKCKISSTQIRVPGIHLLPNLKPLHQTPAQAPPYHLDCMEVPPDDLHHRHREDYNLTSKWIRIRLCSHMFLYGWVTWVLHGTFIFVRGLILILVHLTSWSTGSPKATNESFTPCPKWPSTVGSVVKHAVMAWPPWQGTKATSPATGGIIWNHTESYNR